MSSLLCCHTLSSFSRCRNLCLTEGSQGLQDAESRKPEKGDLRVQTAWLSFFPSFFSLLPPTATCSLGWEAGSGVEEGVESLGQQLQAAHSVWLHGWLCSSQSCQPCPLKMEQQRRKEKGEGTQAGWVRWGEGRAEEQVGTT